MSIEWKRLNSEGQVYPTWTNDDSSKPTTMPDGTPIPVNHFGINVQSLSVYYWTGTEWKKSGGGN